MEPEEKVKKDWHHFENDPVRMTYLAAIEKRKNQIEELEGRLQAYEKREYPERKLM